jgi:zinc finger double-stranded RNA-binding protein
MKKSELLRALQTEILRHDLDTFMNAQHKIVETGCPECQKQFGTIEQFKQHLTDDVLPPLLDKLSHAERDN